MAVSSTGSELWFELLRSIYVILGKQAPQGCRNTRRCFNTVKISHILNFIGSLSQSL